jgi:FAD/FMN-containing dehydrogenase
MMCGSRGGLGIVVEASLKLAPAPEARRALAYRVSAAELADRARWAFLPALEPAWVSVLGPDSGGALPGGAGAFTLMVALEDDAAWVESQTRRVRERLGEPAAILEGDDVRALAERIADLEESAACRLSLTTAAMSPAALAPLAGHAAARTLVFHPLAGRLHLFPEPADAQRIVTELAGHGFTVVEARGAGELTTFPAPQVAVRALRARLRAGLDPEHRFAYGDRWERG